MKSLGKSAWTGAYRLPTDRKDQKQAKRARRTREARTWKREEPRDESE